MAVELDAGSDEWEDEIGVAGRRLVDDVEGICLPPPPSSSSSSTINSGADGHSSPSLSTAADDDGSEKEDAADSSRKKKKKDKKGPFVEVEDEIFGDLTQVDWFELKQKGKDSACCSSQSDGAGDNRPSFGTDPG